MEVMELRVLRYLGKVGGKHGSRCNEWGFGDNHVTKLFILHDSPCIEEYFAFVA